MRRDLDRDFGDRQNCSRHSKVDIRRVFNVDRRQDPGKVFERVTAKNGEILEAGSPRIQTRDGLRCQHKSLFVLTNGKENLDE